MHDWGKQLASTRISSLASIAEIVSAVAIVVTLIVLIVEVRGNTDAMQAQTLESRRDARHQRTSRIIENRGGLADLLTKSQSGSALTDVEEQRLFMYYLDSFEYFEWLYSGVAAGRLDEDQIRLGSWRVVLRPDRAREVFEMVSGGFDPQFVLYVEESVLNRR